MTYLSQSIQMWYISLFEDGLHSLNSLIQYQFLHYIAQLTAGILLKCLGQQGVIVAIATLKFD